MINLMLGKPGGGKSYESVVYHVLPALKSGRMVVTNLPLQIDSICASLGEHVRDLICIVDETNVKKHREDSAVFISTKLRPFSVKPDYINLEWRSAKQQGPLYVLDECHLFIPKTGYDKDVAEFYSLHRHYGIDILLISQSYKKICPEIVEMAQIVYKVQKNFLTGFGKTYFKNVFDGVSGGCVNSEKRKYEAQFFQFYKSHTFSSVSVDEAGASDMKPFWLTKKFLVVYVLIICWFVWIIFFTDWSNPLDAKEKKLASNLQQQTQVDGNPATKTNDVALTPSVPQTVSLSQPSAVVTPDAAHPFYKLALYISGYSSHTQNGREVYDMYFSAKKGSRVVTELKLNDLYLAGYEVVIYSECLAKVSYAAYSDYLVCEKQEFRPQSEPPQDAEFNAFDAVGSELAQN